MGAGCDECAVAVEVHCADGLGMRGQGFMTFSVFDVPDADCFVHAAACEEVSCGIETEAEDVVCMASQSLDTFSLDIRRCSRQEITVFTSHNRTVLSSDPEARRVLFDDQAISLIPFVCPSKF